MTVDEMLLRDPTVDSYARLTIAIDRAADITERATAVADRLAQVVGELVDILEGDQPGLSVIR